MADKLKHIRTLLTVSTLALAIFLFTVQDAHAEANATGQKFDPALDTSKYFSVYSSQTLQQWQYRTGVIFNYAFQPVEFGLTGNRRAPIIDHLVMADIFGSLGFTDWLQFGVNVPIAIFERFFDPDSPLQPNPPGENVFSLGDVRLESKIRLLNDFVHPAGISFRPYVTIPTGDGDVLVGNDSVVFGGDIIVDTSIKDRVFLALNVGAYARSETRPANLNVQVDDMFTYGAGLNIKAADWVDFLFEVFGETLLTDFFQREQEVPVEALGGARFFFADGWQIGVGAGAGLTFGYGAPDFRTVLDISYTKPRVVDLPPPPPPAPPPVVKVAPRKIVITQKIHFEFDKARIRPISFHILDAVVDVMQRNPQITLVEVQGHTDAVGTDEYNARLSDRRSKSVVEYLVSHGVDRSRLAARGFGESQPIDTNDTPLGRARNRRTEFSIISQTTQNAAGAPTSSAPPPAPAPAGGSEAEFTPTF